MTDPPLQLVHLHTTKMTMTLTGLEPERWDHVQYTCCGKNVTDSTVFHVVHWGFGNVTCEECLSGYALEKLAELP
jgi:hypothetical protein